VRLVANLYDLDTGEEVAQGNVEGQASEVLDLADDLAVETMRALLREVGREGAGDLTAENMTTHSLPALAAFLEGEQHYRKGEFAESVQAFERAVAADTAFAIALIRLSESYGWLEDVSSDQMLEYGEKAMAYKDRLSPRYQFMLEAWDALNHLSPDGVEVIKEAVKKYPDDPEAWFLLAETYIHVGGATYGTEEDIVRSLERAVSLDPDFAPYYQHVADFQVIRGQAEEARATIEHYESITGHRRGMEHVEYGIRLFLGDSAEAAAAVQDLMNEDPRIPGLVEGTYSQRMDVWDRAALLSDPIEATQGVNRDPFRTYLAVNQGAMTQAARFADSLNVDDGSLGIFFGHANELWGWSPSGDLASKAPLDLCTESGFNLYCHVFMGGLFVRQERWTEARDTRTSLLAEADRRLGEDPGADVEAIRAAAEYLEAYDAFRRGRPQEARPILKSLTLRGDLVGGRARLAMGELEASDGHVDEAIRHYRASLTEWQRPRAVLELARLYEKAGKTQEALSYWQRMLVGTRSGDPDFPARVEAQEAVARLSQG